MCQSSFLESAIRLTILMVSRATAKFAIDSLNDSPSRQILKANGNMGRCCKVSRGGFKNLYPRSTIFPAFAS
jgi:hypothetical protein